MLLSRRWWHLCAFVLCVLKFFFFSVPFGRRTATALSWLKVALDRVEKWWENHYKKTSPPLSAVDLIFSQRLTLTHTATTTSRLPCTSCLLTRVVATLKLCHMTGAARLCDTCFLSVTVTTQQPVVASIMHWCKWYLNACGPIKIK